MSAKVLPKIGAQASGRIKEMFLKIFVASGFNRGGGVFKSRKMFS